MITTSIQCRFLTAIRRADDSSEIPEGELNAMLIEYIRLLQTYITTHTYVDADDTLDSLISDLDEAASSKKKALTN